MVWLCAGIIQSLLGFVTWFSHYVEEPWSLHWMNLLLAEWSPSWMEAAQLSLCFFDDPHPSVVAFCFFVIFSLSLCLLKWIWGGGIELCQGGLLFGVCLGVGGHSVACFFGGSELCSDHSSTCLVQSQGAWGRLSGGVFACVGAVLHTVAHGVPARVPS